MIKLGTAKSDKDIPDKYKKHPVTSTFKERVEEKKEKEAAEEDIQKLKKLTK